MVTSVDQLDRHSPMPLLGCRLKGYHQASASSWASLAAAQKSPNHAAPPAAALGVLIPSEAFAALCPPGFPWLTAPQHRALDDGMAATLDTVTWSFHSQGSAMMDSCHFDSVTPEDGWNGTIRRGFSRWFAACRMERVDVRWTLVRTVELPAKAVRAQVSRRPLL